MHIADTLRYYEKIGLLLNARRQGPSQVISVVSRASVCLEASARH